MNKPLPSEPRVTMLALKPQPRTEYDPAKVTRLKSDSARVDLGPVHTLVKQLPGIDMATLAEKLGKDWRTMVLKAEKQGDIAVDRFEAPWVAYPEPINVQHLTSTRGTTRERIIKMIRDAESQGLKHVYLPELSASIEVRAARINEILREMVAAGEIKRGKIGAWVVFR